MKEAHVCVVEHATVTVRSIRYHGAEFEETLNQLHLAAHRHLYAYRSGRL